MIFRHRQKHHVLKEAPAVHGDNFFSRNRSSV